MSLERKIQEAKRQIENALEKAIASYLKAAREHPEHFDGLSEADIEEQILEMLWNEEGD